MFYNLLGNLGTKLDVPFCRAVGKSEIFGGELVICSRIRVYSYSCHNLGGGGGSTPSLDIGSDGTIILTVKLMTKPPFGKKTRN